MEKMTFIRGIALRAAAFSLAGILCAGISFAYIDPGTGGMIIGSIWPAIAGFFVAIGAFFVGIYRKTIKAAFSNLFSKKK